MPRLRHLNAGDHVRTDVALAHHVDSGIPWRRLPALHDELVSAGWITPDLEYPSYLALWRALASRSVPPEGVGV